MAQINVETLLAFQSIFSHVDKFFIGIKSESTFIFDRKKIDKKKDKQNVTDMNIVKIKSMLTHFKIMNIYIVIFRKIETLTLSILTF